MEQKLRLRGHHIEHLAETFYKKHNSVIKNSFNYSGLDSPYTHFDKEETAYLNSIFKNKVTEKFSLFGEEYDAFLEGVSKDLEEIIILSPEAGIDIPIQVVFGPDTPCGLCPRNLVCKNESSPGNDEDDSRALMELGLQVGRVYSATEILDKIKAWQEQNNAPSPRQKKLNVYGLSSL